MDEESLKIQRRKRNYFSEDFIITSREALEEEFKKLLSEEITTADALVRFLEKFTELADIIGEEYAWKYINMTRFADKPEYQKEFNEFYGNIMSLTMQYEFLLKKKFYECPLRNELPKEKYDHLNKIISNSIEIFRQENIPLFVKESELSNKYGETISKMTIVFKGEEKTFSQMNIFLKDHNRSIREEAWKLKYAKLKENSENFDELFDELKKIRVQEAKNAGFSNYRDFKHIEKGRFSYSVEDILQFHDSVEKVVVPFAKKRTEIRRKKLNLDSVRPWDTAVETDGKTLKPFSNIDEFVEKAVKILSGVKPGFGEALMKMKVSGFLDLENRKGKAPGGYNFGLPESGASFIFMNAIGIDSDARTILHESGHAMHSRASNPIKVYFYKEHPMEVAELASMSMELLTVDKLHYYYPNENDFKKAKREEIEGTLTFLPWCMTVDAFQHWVYTITHTIKERRAYFKSLMERFSSGVNWSGLEDIEEILWMQQLHIFEVPFYYIEYGMAQLGALAIYRNYKENPKKTVEDYENFLKLGYTKSVPELYKAAGIEFNFSSEYIKGLVDFVNKELDTLD